MTEVYIAPWQNGGRPPERPRSLYHGGPAGLEVGSLILPVSETGRKPYGEFQRSDRVYRTSDGSIDGAPRNATGQLLDSAIAGL